VFCHIRRIPECSPEHMSLLGKCRRRIGACELCLWLIRKTEEKRNSSILLLRSVETFALTLLL
jgi:hypothetical protein